MPATASQPRVQGAAAVAGPRPVDASPYACVGRSRRRRAMWMLLGVAVLAVLAVVSIAFGSRTVSGADILAALGGAAEGFDQAAVAKRIPRTALAVLAGAGLGVSGAVMQGVTRNPLADPGILGINTGASLAVAIGIVTFSLDTATGYIWTAILGAAVTAVFVYLVGSLGRDGATPLKLALAGAATTAALTSFISAVVLPRADLAGSVLSWQIGGVGGATPETSLQMLPFLVVGFAICLLSAKGLNMLGLGDELAAGLGERVALTRVVAALGAVVLCGSVTAMTGPIAFVGLVVPHVCRLLGGVDHRWLLPFAAILGAILLTAADVAGRVVARPDEIDVGIIVALIGAPFFIAVVRRQRLRAL